MAIYYGAGTYYLPFYGNSSSTDLYVTTTSSSGTATTYDDGWSSLSRIPPRTIIKEVIPDILSPDKKMEIHLKDGTIIHIDNDHNLKIDDSAAEVIYKSNRVREFNRYVNASDLLEEFIRDMGRRGARQSEILNVPIEVFINWIIFKAAEQDGDEASKPRLPAPKCRACGRFIPKVLAAKGFEFCNQLHSALYLEHIQQQLRLKHE